MQVGIAKKFKADLGNLPGSIARKALVWLADFMLDPEDARFEAHRVTRTLMRNLWTAKLDDSWTLMSPISLGLDKDQLVRVLADFRRSREERTPVPPDEAYKARVLERFDNLA
jgi:hypothetical protein